MTGRTDSSDFPTMPGAYDTQHDGTSDGFVTKLLLEPRSTPGCKVSGSGRITAANGDLAIFGGSVRAASDAGAVASCTTSITGRQRPSGSAR